MSKIERKSKGGAKRKKKIILTVTLSILLTLIGFGVPCYFYLSKRIYVFTVTDIQLEQEPIVGIEVKICITAKYHHSVPPPSIRVFIFPSRCAQQLHIWVLGYSSSGWHFDWEIWTNQTVQYSFPTAGTWQLIAGEYITEIIVS